MAELLIKGPDGRVITCPRGWTVATVVNDRPVITVNAAALKPGWSVVEEVAFIAPVDLPEIHIEAPAPVASEES